MTYQKCDRCGTSTEENETRSYDQIYINKVSFSGFPGIYPHQCFKGIEMDLCAKCHDEIYKLLNKQVKEIK